MDSTDWDTRYAGSELVWSATPNVWVEQVCSALPPGTAIDLGAGEARNALWLAARGWQATAVDFSEVALERARRLAVERLGENAHRLHTACADLTTFEPDAVYDLALVVYLQVPAPQRRTILNAAARCLAPGGRLVVVAHHSDNLAAGVGGPQDPAVLYTESDVLDDLATSLAGGGFVTERADRVVRAVGQERSAIDTLVVLRRG
ncbi:MAG: class I SAM-dependent methyltransferase [Kineosporiaceae bacterium]|nr:class I SAM-dependent methyltransferase [Kineosporiaceae bacterium]MBK7622356.1 class I SAM-dependent methyltransferase [Kineosporiaceae bacterium]MBK8074684.1 class I SAM-dependent methyltransferase [Kineosporiaceae bacterium]